MVGENVALLLIGIALLLIVFALGGAVVDRLDPYGEREDAYRRNHR